MKNWILALGVVAGGALVCVAGCSSDHDDGHAHKDGGAHSSPYPDCDTIAKACHSVDVGEGEIHDCHEKAHGATSEADCTPLKAKCVTICAAAAADAGAGDHDEHDGG